MKTIIAGTREIADYSLVKQAVEESGFDVTCVVSGGARGVDALGEQYARDNGLPVILYVAEWDDLSYPDAIIKVNKFGKQYDARAGLRRNVRMAKNAEALVAIWDGKSSGTKHMIDMAYLNGLKVYVKTINAKKKVKK